MRTPIPISRHGSLGDNTRGVDRDAVLRDLREPGVPFTYNLAKRGNR